MLPRFSSEMASEVGYQRQIAHTCGTCFGMLLATNRAIPTRNKSPPLKSTSSFFRTAQISVGIGVWKLVPATHDTNFWYTYLKEEGCWPGNIGISWKLGLQRVIIRLRVSRCHRTCCRKLRLKMTYLREHDPFPLRRGLSSKGIQLVCGSQLLFDSVSLKLKTRGTLK